MNAVIAFIQIFSSTWSSILSTFASGLLSYRQFAFVVAIISTLLILKLFSDFQWKIPKSTFRFFVIYCFIVLMYLITPYFYSGIINERYASFRLALIGQVFPGILTASLISNREDIQEKMQTILPYIAILFAIIAFISSRFPNMETTGGYAENSNGLNYQSISYVAAFASGLAETFLISHDDEKGNRVLRVIMILTTILSFISILLAGGRGGFVLFVFFLILTFIVSRKNISISGLLKAAITICLIIVATILAYRYAINSDVQTIGIDRIGGLLSGAGDSGRNSLRGQALTIFTTSPFCGHGLGSVFYEMSYYSHNIITDSLVETGVLGTAVLIAVLVVTIVKEVRLIRYERSNVLWLYIFFCGFIEGMFSGYYLTQMPMYWAIGFILSKPLYQEELKVQALDYGQETGL